MISQILAVTAGILAAVVLIGAATSAALKLWRFRVVQLLCLPVTVSAGWTAWVQHRQERFDEKVVIAVEGDERIEVIVRSVVTEVVTEVVAEQLDRLFIPNGGASLHDLATRFTAIEERLGIHNQHTDRTTPAPDKHLPVDRRKAEQ